MASSCASSISSPTDAPSVGSSSSGPSDEAFKSRRGQYFWHTRAAIGHATALARRARVAEHTLRRTRAGPHTQDDLLYPPTAI